MIFGNSNELAEFVDSLLKVKPKEALSLLEEEDLKLLSYANNTMIHKMPKELQPQKQHSNSPQHTTQDLSHAFPSMFQATHKKTYEYINEDIDNMKKVATGYSSHVKSLPKQPRTQGKTSAEQQMTQKDEIIVEAQAIKESEPAPQSHKQNQSGHSLPSAPSSFNKSHSVSKPLPSPTTKNPFVPNSINFTDKFANSKVLHQKYQHLSFSQSARNLTAMAQTAKHSAFTHSVAFPTTVLAGTMMPPDNRTFSREAKLDVDDVMRYTLGVKRDKTDKKPTENPFVRVPKRRE